MSTSRRQALGKMVAGTAVLMISDTITGSLMAADKKITPAMKGHINHSVCKWCFRETSLEDLCKAGKDLGLQSIELLSVDDFPLLQRYGLECGIDRKSTRLNSSH